MKVIYTPTHELHDPPKEIELGYFVPFKESPQRVDNIMESILGINPDEAVIPPVDHGLDPILTVHSKEYVEYFESAYNNVRGNPEGVFPDGFAVRDFANRRHWENANAKPEAPESEFSADGGVSGQPGYFCFDMTGVITEGTYKAAYDAAQVALTGADLLVQEKLNGIFALCRPPGHHAHKDLCGGYCFFNNVAIAVKHLLDTHKVGKIAILDIDYHHGNGTQEIFYEQSNPLYVSLHGFPDYPYYWGASSETGAGAGEGYNVNVPLPLGTRDSEYLMAISEVVDGRVKDFEPDYIVVSLGVDTYMEDKVGNFLLTSECFYEIGRVVASLGKPTLFVMEGGYDIPAIGKNVTNVLRGFEDGFQTNAEAKETVPNPVATE
ncbi:hypothetical protein HDU76_004708 [Blyttiomyces sp. JEL0837]|nr:hypothetical protein HDU76_004708 [Blyttiomyces sp. JEL0837]